MITHKTKLELTVIFRFGASYDLEGQPDGIKYCVDKAMLGAKYWGLSKFHIVRHYSGASIATELAVVHGDKVITLMIIGPVLLKLEE